MALRAYSRNLRWIPAAVPAFDLSRRAGEQHGGNYARFRAASYKDITRPA
jgi:hypothetical protein